MSRLMLWDVIIFVIGPVLAIVALLVAARAVNGNWRFGMRGLLMLLTLIALGMGAIAVLTKSQ
jgi:hypothetical protein